jgi:glycosyltransferase involved in cell wall biosynthesis
MTKNGSEKLKILFLIHDLGQGGAEKVLVNLVNHMDLSRFDVTVEALFAGGVNEQFLRPEVRYLTVYKRTVPGNSHLMKLFSPEKLHKKYVKGHYDIEVSYLEGPSARIISGCTDPETRKVVWIHRTMDEKHFVEGFRSHEEAIRCYQAFDRIISVSEGVKEAFSKVSGLTEKCEVLYNVLDTEKIHALAQESAEELSENDGTRLVAMGSLKEGKGFERLLGIIKKLTRVNQKFTLYILGKGPLEAQLQQSIGENGLKDCVRLLGYQTNPYRILSKCDLFICPSFAEGFSTAAAEALIVGTPVCTTEVSGMRELLGEQSEFGVITENSEEGLYQGIKGLLEDPERLAHYRKQAAIRGEAFKDEQTVKAVEEMLLGL